MIPMASCPILRPASLRAIVLYGQRSLPQIAPRRTVMSASVGSIRRASGTVSIRTSPAPYITVARIWLSLLFHPRAFIPPTASRLAHTRAGRALEREKGHGSNPHGPSLRLSDRRDSPPRGWLVLVALCYIFRQHPSAGSELPCSGARSVRRTDASKSASGIESNRIRPRGAISA